MKKSVKQKVDYFISSLPDYVNDISHSADAHRLFDVALEISRQNDSTDDVCNYIAKNVSHNQFHRESVIEDSKNILWCLQQFIDYCVNQGVLSL